MLKAVCTKIGLSLEHKEHVGSLAPGPKSGSHVQMPPETPHTVAHSEITLDAWAKKEESTNGAGPRLRTEGAGLRQPPRASDNYATFFVLPSPHARPSAPTSSSDSLPSDSFKLEGIQPDQLSQEQRAAVVASLRALLEARSGGRSRSRARPQEGGHGAASQASGSGSAAPAAPELAVSVRAGCISIQLTGFQPLSSPCDPQGAPRLERMSDLSLTWEDILSVLPPELRAQAVRPKPSLPTPRFRILPGLHYHSGHSASAAGASSDYPVIIPDLARERITVRLRVADPRQGQETNDANGTPSHPSAFPSAAAYLSSLWTPVVYLGGGFERLPLLSADWADVPSERLRRDSPAWADSVFTPGIPAAGSGGMSLNSATVEARLQLPSGSARGSSFASRLVVQLAPRDGGAGPEASSVRPVLMVSAGTAADIRGLSPHAAAGIVGDLLSVMQFLEAAEMGFDPRSQAEGPEVLPPAVNACLSHMEAWARGRRHDALASVAEGLRKRAAIVESRAGNAIGNVLAGPSGSESIARQFEAYGMNPWTLRFLSDGTEASYLKLVGATSAAIRFAFIVLVSLTSEVVPILQQGLGHRFTPTRAFLPVIAIWALAVGLSARSSIRSLEARLRLSYLLVAIPMVSMPDVYRINCSQMQAERWGATKGAVWTLAATLLSSTLVTLSGMPFRMQAAVHLTHAASNYTGLGVVARSVCLHGHARPFAVVMGALYPFVSVGAPLMWVRRRERAAREAFMGKVGGKTKAA